MAATDSDDGTHHGCSHWVDDDFHNPYAPLRCHHESRAAWFHSQGQAGEHPIHQVHILAAVAGEVPVVMHVMLRVMTAPELPD
jgi:hypothetical protein